MTEELHLVLLGEPQVIQGGTPVAGFISSKAQALLFYLVVTGQTHGRESLAGLLWGDMPQSKARKNLTKALSNLRSLLGEYLVIDRQSAAFNQEASYRLDVEMFQETLERPSPEATLDTLRQAVALYRDDFLAGFSVKEAPAFEEWALLERERLHKLRLQALQTLADRLEAGADYDAAINTVEQLLALDPYRESAHRQKMMLLARIGRRSAALAQYETCCRILAEELDTAPMPETQALYERLKIPDVTPRHNLPSPATAFVGREEELGQLTALLDDPTCRLLTVVGPGGIGKTRLALQTAARYARPEQSIVVSQFPDGVYFVPLAPLDTADGVLPALAEALSFSFYEQAKPRQQLLDYLRQKKVLLVMDSFEHLLAAPPASSRGATRETAVPIARPGGKQGGELVAAIIGNAPGVKILATSRVRLNVQGEYLFPLAGMDSPEVATAEEARRLSAVRLFLESARRVRPDFELTLDNAADVVRICRLVQGMPLAILLAAAWVTVLTPAEIATEIGRSLDILETDMHDVPRRQRSIRAAFDYSWGLLTDREREVFRQLSVFRGDFTRQAIQAVTGVSLRELMALVNKTLLHRTPDGRYAVHGLLRQYAAEKLEQTPDAATAARNRHGAYYTAVLHKQAAHLHGPQQQTALLAIEAEIQNAQVAWQWAATHGQSEQLDQMMDSLAYFYTWRGRYQEAEAAFRVAADGLPTVADGDRLRTLARLLSWQGMVSHHLGWADTAAGLLQRSLDLLDHPALRGQDTRPEKAFALLQLGEIARETDRTEARRLYEESLDLYRALGNDWDAANALASLGWLIQHLGAYDEAGELYEESLSIRQGLGDRWGMASSLNSLGGIALYQGRHQEAERLIEESVAIRQELDDRVGLARSLSRLGEVRTWLGQFSQARAPLEESKSIYDDLGLRDAATFCIAMLANVETHLGNYRQARLWGEEALSLFQSLDSQRGVGYALLGLGGVTLALRETAEAGQLLQESLAIYREIGQRDEIGQALVLLSYAAQQSGQRDQAWQYLVEAVQTAREIRAFMPLALALPAIALLLLEQGDPEQAVALYALASRYALVANSHWFGDMAGRRLEATAATLPPEVVSVARARGESKMLESIVVDQLAAADIALR